MTRPGGNACRAGWVSANAWPGCWRRCSVSGALLVVGNTVRLDIQSRREEIGVLQLLGATDGFIRRPFIYLGAWYGLAAGALALGLLAAAAYALRAPLHALAQSYGSGFALGGLDPAARRGLRARGDGDRLAGCVAGDRTFPAPNPTDGDLEHALCIRRNFAT